MGTDNRSRQQYGSKQCDIQQCAKKKNHNINILVHVNRNTQQSQLIKQITIPCPVILLWEFVGGHLNISGSGAAIQDHENNSLWIKIHLENTSNVHG